MQHFLRLSNLFWRMVLLQAKPQDVPASNSVLFAAVAAVAAVNLIALIPRYGVSTGVMLVVFDLLFLVTVLRFALRLANKSARFSQSLAALCGSGAWLSVLSLPLLFTAEQVGGIENASASLILLLIGFHVWNVTVIGHIVRHSFEVSFAAAVAGAIAYTFGVIAIAEMIIPIAGPAVPGTT